MMSAFADLATLDPDYGSIYSHIFASTYANAPSSQGHANFLDDYYDDEGWWGLAWLNVYRLTNDADYLNAAITIFDDMRGGWTTPCGGGIYWEKSATYIASIANGLSSLLFLIVVGLEVDCTSTVHPTRRRARE